MKFSLGQVVATPKASAAVSDADRHGSSTWRSISSGNWGEVDNEDWKSSDTALVDGSRLMSAFPPTLGPSTSRIFPK
jgi:hypothetical protein